MSELPLVVALTGASGAPYGLRLLQVLSLAGREVHWTLSESAAIVIKQETGVSLSVKNPDPRLLGELGSGRLIFHHYGDLAAAIASGSFTTAGMAICPCSMSTLAAVAYGLTENLITRAADVHLKERRRLILVPRETPLSLVHLEAMTAVTRAGAVVLPAAPGWYHRPTSTSDLVDFVVARVCDHLGVAHTLGKRWTGTDRSAES